MPSEPAIPLRVLLAGARGKQPSLLDLARRLILAESPSGEKSALDACVALAAAHAAALGARVRLHRQRASGNTLEARFGPRSRSAAPVLLLGHLDTVWPLGTLTAMPCRVANGRLFGPGALDMKAGVAMAFTALEMLAEAGILDREIVLFLNTDEEIGSPASRPLIERLAASSSAVYVLEPGQGLACKTARKGTGRWRIQVRGVAAHAGVDFAAGASALREVARIIETVSGWTGLRPGLTINVGQAGGGSRPNVVPAEAWAEVDVRIARASDGPRMARKFAALRPADPRCTLTVTGAIERPPMERTRGTVRLYRRARTLASGLGFTLDEASTGGASDGNFASALGIPTLDGLGAVGEGAHAAHESVEIDHLAPRTALLAALFATRE